jgi:hypothetical protein
MLFIESSSIHPLIHPSIYVTTHPFTFYPSMISINQPMTYSWISCVWRHLSLLVARHDPPFRASSCSPHPCKQLLVLVNVVVYIGLVVVVVDVGLLVVDVDVDLIVVVVDLDLDLDSCCSHVSYHTL